METEMLTHIQDIVPEDNEKEDNLYNAWKKNTPLLYDTLVNHVFEWPTLTTQFLPIHQENSDGNYDHYKMVLGTQTDNSISNYLMIAKVTISI